MCDSGVPLFGGISGESQAGVAPQSIAAACELEAGDSTRQRFHSPDSGRLSVPDDTAVRREGGTRSARKFERAGCVGYGMEFESFSKFVRPLEGEISRLLMRLLPPDSNYRQRRPASNWAPNKPNSLAMIEPLRTDNDRRKDVHDVPCAEHSKCIQPDDRSRAFDTHEARLALGIQCRIETARFKLVAQFRPGLEKYAEQIDAAINEAETTARQTGFPDLFFPELAAERMRKILTLIVLLEDPVAVEVFAAAC